MIRALTSVNALRAMTAACFVSAVVLCITFWVYVPINVDGGWYAYPALSMSQGRDPGENQLPVEQLLDETTGIKAHYEWDSRRSLLVLPMAAWFTIVGHDLDATRAYAVVEYLVVLLMFYLLANRLADGNRLVALAVTAVLATDIKLINAAMADLRPDMALAIISLIILFVFESDLRRLTAGKLAIAGVAALALPLAHMTAPVVLGFITVFCFVRAFFARDARRTTFAIVIFACMSIAFLLRNPILDVLVATSVDELYHFNLDERIAGIFANGFWAKAGIELRRWSDYFLISNLVQGLVIAVSLVVTVAALLRRQIPAESRLFALLVAFPVPFVVVFLFDSYARADHVIPVVTLWMLLPVFAWRQLQESRVKPVLIAATVAGLAACTGLKALHANSLWQRFESLGLSNAAVQAALTRQIADRTHTLIFGPVEIWPYLPENANVLIVDERNKLVERSADAWQSFDLVVLNADIIGYRWPERFQDNYQGLALLPIQEIGDPASEFFVGFYTIAASSR